MFVISGKRIDFTFVYFVKEFYSRRYCWNFST